MQLSIVGDFFKYTSKSLKDFISESNQGRLIRFVLTVDDVRAFQNLEHACLCEVLALIVSGYRFYL